MFGVLLEFFLGDMLWPSSVLCDCCSLENTSKTCDWCKKPACDFCLGAFAFRDGRSYCQNCVRRCRSCLCYAPCVTCAECNMIYCNMCQPRYMPSSLLCCNWCYTERRAARVVIWWCLKEAQQNTGLSWTDVAERMLK